MISTDGAALIATLLPIGLIVLAFERRSPRPKVSTGKRLIWELPRLFAGGIVVCLSLYSMWRCVFSVSSATPLGGADAVAVGASMILMWVVVGTELVAQTFDRYDEAFRAGQRDKENRAEGA
ncbi:hypothetical protein NY537_05400 [Curtobacterium flaccumfaciens pv. betae]|uniref:hypothetical protein n=1 Tax=Curtobacterium flaccumfaciens TaxID=2035 RepID=UPI0026592DBF|nr:hypothetical protein [Curtobacterium flaccumfaciens]MCS5512184.1 hypothetical protein [Curtobacterium flaccumfaciens pv. betae]